jgi:hypothetical protein
MELVQGAKKLKHPTFDVLFFVYSSERTLEQEKTTNAMNASSVINVTNYVELQVNDFLARILLHICKSMKAAAQAYHLEALNEIKYVVRNAKKKFLIFRAFWTFVKSKDNNDANALPSYAQRIYDACKFIFCIYLPRSSMESSFLFHCN